MNRERERCRTFAWWFCWEFLWISVKINTVIEPLHLSLLPSLAQWWWSNSAAVQMIKLWQNGNIQGNSDAREGWSLSGSAAWFQRYLWKLLWRWDKFAGEDDQYGSLWLQNHDQHLPKMDLSEFQTPKMLHFLKPSVPQSFEPWPWPAMDHLMRPGDGTDWEAIGRIEGGAWGLANRANRGRAEDLRWFELTSKWSTPKSWWISYWTLLFVGPLGHQVFGWWKTHLAISNEFSTS